LKNDKTDFTQGSILKKLALFMLPILGALVLQAAYGAVDLLVVGRFGSTSGLSAVSTGSQVLNLVTFVVTQLAMGVTVLIARYLGEKKHEFISPVIGGAAVVFALLAAVLFGVLVFLARPISSLMQAPAEALDLTTSYVRICGAGIFFIVAYNMLSALFRGLGDSRSPLIFVLVACVVNIIGDLVLVAGFHLDAVGAAIATVAAQAVSVVCAVIMLLKKDLPFSIKKADFRLNFQCKKFLAIGLPLALFSSESSYSACADLSSAGAQALSARLKQALAGFMTSGSPGWDAWTPQDRDALHFDADSETACITLNSYPDTRESIRAAMAADTSLSAAEKETVEHLYFSGLSF
jgi:putative MATE family efflux protein